MPSTQQTQHIALTLIAVAAICIGIGSHYEWRDLVNFATMFGGAGAGILTGRQSTKNDCDTDADPS